VPDLEALTAGLGEGGRKVEPFGVPERSLHFIDLEYFFPDDARRSYDALPLIGHAAQAAYTRDGTSWKFDADKFYHFKGTVNGKATTVLQMKARQMAWGVKRTQRLWRKAWDEGHPAGG